MKNKKLFLWKLYSGIAKIFVVLLFASILDLHTFNILGAYRMCIMAISISVPILALAIASSYDTLFRDAEIKFVWWLMRACAGLLVLFSFAIPLAFPYWFTAVLVPIIIFCTTNISEWSRRIGLSVDE